MTGRHTGFTLTEILVVLTIVMILGVMAIPSLGTLHQHMTARLVRDSLAQVIEDTRLQAVLQHQAFLLAGNPEWATGWIRKTRNGRVLATGIWRGQGRLHFRLFPKGRTTLVFRASGWPEVENGTFWYCLAGASRPVWALVLDRSGRVRIMSAGQQWVSC